MSVYHEYYTNYNNGTGMVFVNPFASDNTWSQQYICQRGMERKQNNVQEMKSKKALGYWRVATLKNSFGKRNMQCNTREMSSLATRQR